MNKLVVLSLGVGDLENGFPAVIAQLWEPGASYPMQFRGCLPAAPEILELHRSWQLLYKAIYHRPEWQPRIKINAAGITNVSRAEFRDLCQQLSNKINLWLNSEPFRNIDQQLRTKLDSWDEIRVVIATDNIQLRRLPWHLWNFFEDFPKAEVALSASEYQRSRKLRLKNLAAKVRILAVLGNSKGIDIAADRTFLEQLSNQAETKFLVEPQPEQLNDQLWKDWDILFFAGHSSSQEKGLLQLNQTDSLTLDQLKYALKKAVERGLKLAIFNSCDGLGLAQQLADLQIPQVIVMREPVPDIVAQKFLRQFLTCFSEGKTLYASMREARERLQGLERDFPCASWLPVICQNPAEEPSTWQKWCTPKQDGAGGTSQGNHQASPTRRPIRMALIASVVVTALVMGVRYLGLLQAWELQVFDQLMRIRPDEAQDQRLLVVTITEADFQLPEQKQRKGSLSDLALARLLEKLESYQPRAIGLDIYREDSVNPTQAELATRLRNQDGLFAICKVQDQEINHPGIAPPPEVPAERQGFSDISKDPDGILRRHLLAMQPSPASPCTVPYALSAQLAFHYLEAEGMTAKYTQKGDLQLGNVVFKRLQAPMGGYQRVDTWGYQVLLNYRSHRSPLEIAPRVTLTDILTGVVKPDQVRGRIVLIGVSAQSAHDYIPTPYSDNQRIQEIPGVMIQAQMVSQILSAVKDGRPLLRVWPLWGEVLWVWVWSAVGGLLVWYCQGRRRLVLVGVVSLGVLSGLCFGLFIRGYWIPLVPSALVLVITGGSVGVYVLQQRQQSSSSLRQD